jgi:hypothetical protein
VNKAELLMDKDLQAVVEFMQANVESQKLFAVADALPTIARLLWGDVSQEPIKAISLRACLDLTQPIASGCDLEHRCVGDGSAAEAFVQPHL